MGSGDPPPCWRMSSGSDSGHQSRLVRPSSERTVVGRSTGQPIDPVLASICVALFMKTGVPPLKRLIGRRKQVVLVSESKEIDYSRCERGRQVGPRSEGG